MSCFLETPLQIAPNVCQQALSLAKAGKLTARVSTWRAIKDTSTPSEIEAVVGVRAAREIKRRKSLMLRQYPNGAPIQFIQHDLPSPLADALIDACPDWLKRLGSAELNPIVQISTGGNMLHPHRGHKRKASIFCLLAGDEERTTWYNETSDFEVIDAYRIPDISKIAPAVTTTLKQGVWTFFDHETWHSVSSDKDITFRVNIGIDFETLSFAQATALYAKASAI
jgi:hypothetical protein